ncbi:MAG: hypothetical protein ACRDZX_12180 [Acidimicrobiales bacterium]
MGRVSAQAGLSACQSDEACLSWGGSATMGARSSLSGTGSVRRAA